MSHDLYTERDGAGERTYAPSVLAEELTHDEMLTLAGFIVLHVVEGLRGHDGYEEDEHTDLDRIVDTLGYKAQALRDEPDEVDLAAVCEGSDDEGNTLYIVDCQVCGIIVDTVSEALYGLAASLRASDLCKEHNVTHHQKEDT